MAATTETEEQVSLKLVVNKDTNKVLFAEAGKDFVDVLCSFLTLPLGTIARLLRKESEMEQVTVGCLNSLYQSVENLDKECLKTATCKEMLLQPRNSSEEYCRSLKLNIDDTEPMKYYVCSAFGPCMAMNLTTFKNQICDCEHLLDREVSVESGYVSDGFVNHAASYIITDNLIVVPNSVDSSFDLLTMHESFGIQSTSSVKEMTVNVNKKKVLDLLKCCLHSETTLTDLFLENKPFLQRQNCFSPCDVTDNSSSIQIKVKLFIRKSDCKVMFAQGDADFADFILSFLTFPLGGVVRMLGGKCSLGSIDRLYKSIADLDENKYIVFLQDKNTLVNPCIASQFKIGKQILPISEQCAASYYCYYQLSDFAESITNNDFTIANYKHEYCSRKNMVLDDPKLSYRGCCEGYVKEAATFIVTDDLVISPMSLVSSLKLLDGLGTPRSDLMGKVVTIGFNEGLSILKAALTSTSALTNGLRHLVSQKSALTNGLSRLFKQEK